jgi:hypothetical protein
MTSMEQFAGRNRDMQDNLERMVFGKLTHLGTGAVVKLRGNGTEDEEVRVINIGQGMNFAENTNTEVLVIASGSDTNMKFALLQIPADKQRPWGEGNGGIQNPTDPDKAIEFNSKRTWLTEGNAAIGPDGIFEVKDGKVYIRAELVVEGQVTSNNRFKSPNPGVNGREDIPGFDK